MPARNRAVGVGPAFFERTGDWDDGRSQVVKPRSVQPEYAP